MTEEVGRDCGSASILLQTGYRVALPFANRLELLAITSGFGRIFLQAQSLSVHHAEAGYSNGRIKHSVQYSGQ